MKSGAIEQRVFIGLLRAADGLNGDLARLLRPKGLTTPAYNVLRILRGGPDDGLPCSEIGARMINRDSDVTRLTDRLVAQGLAARKRQEEDRRVVKVAITDRGHELLRELDEPVLALHKEQLRHVSRSDLTALARLLGRVLEEA